MSPNKGKKKTARRKRGSVDCKTVLMDAVVHLTAESGIENLSTRIIADTAPGVSGDVYIYNIFGSKENLLLETFLREDAKYAEVFEKSSSVLWETGMALESRLRNLWHGVWSWLTIANPGTCLFSDPLFLQLLFRQSGDGKASGRVEAAIRKIAGAVSCGGYGADDGNGGVVFADYGVWSRSKPRSIQRHSVGKRVPDAGGTVRLLARQ